MWVVAWDVGSGSVYGEGVVDSRAVWDGGYLRVSTRRSLQLLRGETRRTYAREERGANPFGCAFLTELWKKKKFSSFRIREGC